jgi:hypothetical protein
MKGKPVFAGSATTSGDNEVTGYSQEQTDEV